MLLLSAALAIALSVAGHSHFEKPVPLNPLDAIEKFESGGRNVRNYRYDPTHTAQGHFQITNSTWKSIAPKAGIDLSQYPTAETAPYGVQRAAAAALYNRGGFSDWEPYNPKLRSFIAQNGRDAFVKPGTLGSEGGHADMDALLGGEDDEATPSAAAIGRKGRSDGGSGGPSGAPASVRPPSLDDLLKAINEPARDPIHAEIKSLMADLLADAMPPVSEGMGHADAPTMAAYPAVGQLAAPAPPPLAALSG